MDDEQRKALDALLCVEISSDHSMLLPHDEFAFAELKSEGDEQELRLVFAMHEVLVRGHSLRRIETAMQRSELSLLTALSGKQRSLIPDGQPVILTIIVTKLNSDEERGEGVSGALKK